MLKSQQFLTAFTEHKPALKAWGELVKNKVLDHANLCGLTPQILSYRVKDEESAIGKLARKNYINPIEDMTDLVGVRAVFTLSSDLLQIKSSLLNDDSWNITVSRDTNEEHLKKPNEFSYSSIHFEIRPKDTITIDKVEIPKACCCELQIRTLMQHTYAEVVHDSIYKGDWSAPPKANRFVASSAALIETADHLFCETVELLEHEKKTRGPVLESLADLYKTHINIQQYSNQELSLYILSHFSDKYEEESIIKQIEDLLEERNFIIDRIQSRLEVSAFWEQPVVLFIYFLAKVMKKRLLTHWPDADTADHVHRILADFGISTD